ncbi:MAG: regulatory protein RecX [Nitrospiraceae bacterium]|nr:regulatory protein RecX [Nitrospiraceae bacterium]
MPPGAAFKYALRLLGYRGRSRAELEERLSRKGFDPAAAAAALQKLERLGYIDDSALAAALSRQARQNRKLGRKGAFLYLLGRGIPEELALAALAGYDEFEGAEKVARKKLDAMKREGPATVRRRLYGALARRGYSAETIRKVFSSIMKEDM